MKLKNLPTYGMLLLSIVFCFLLAMTFALGSNKGSNGLAAGGPFNLNANQLLTMFLLAFIVIIALLIMILITNHFSKSIAKIVETIHTVDRGDFDIRFEYDENNEFGEIAEAFNNLMETVVNNTNEIEKARTELQSLTNNIPGGVYKCKDDIAYTLYYISDGFVNVVGCSKEEIYGEYQGKIMNFIHPEDRERVVQHVNTQLARTNTYEMQYRMVRKDQTICWVLDKGMCVHNEETGEFQLNGVIIDITALTEAMERRRKNDENYRIIGEQSDDIIVEWDFANDKVSFTPNWYEKFTYEPIKENASEALLLSKNIFPDDLKAFQAWAKKIYKSKENATVEFRLKANNDTYIWVRIRTTAIIDDDGVAIKAVGAITDINHQKTREEQLLKKAEVDILTKIFNRGAFEERAFEQIEEAKKAHLNLAFLFIDIDDFRYYNSEFGHSFGDKIIVFIGERIKKVIEEIGFAGRCGGDEFIICIYDQEAVDDIGRVAQNLIDELKAGFYYEQYDKMIEVNCSIGIVQFPKIASTYEQLIITADEAMYKAKQAGKGRYHIHHNPVKEQRGI